MRTDASRIGLADRLRRETRALHATAERAGVMRDILGGRFDRGAYCALLRNLYEVYAALEPALDRHADHPCIAPVYQPALFRTGALAADLLALGGPRWIDDADVAPSGREYGRRIGEVAQTRPELLVAHAYTRYLGDLNGGRILGRIVADTLALEPGSGTRFYAFPAVADLAETAARYRAALDALPVDAAAADAIVAEANHAFGLHVRLFEELAAARATPRQSGS